MGRSTALAAALEAVFAVGGEACENRAKRAAPEGVESRGAALTACERRVSIAPRGSHDDNEGGRGVEFSAVRRSRVQFSRDSSRFTLRRDVSAGVSMPESGRDGLRAQAGRRVQLGGITRRP
jgi:hypothetical protein